MSFPELRMWAGRTVGLMGGSFNPAHEGHLSTSLHALETLRLDAIWWLVSPQNPLKSEDDMAPLDQRLASAKAMATDPRIYAWTLEIELKTRYTVDTIDQLKALFPKTTFVWLMGADNLLQVPQWKDWKRLFNMLPIAIFDRPGYTEKALDGEAVMYFKGCRMDAQNAGELTLKKPPAWVLLENPLSALSSTAIRKKRQEAEGSLTPDRMR